MMKADMRQLAGQRKKNDDSDNSNVGSQFVGLRTPYWG